MADEKKEIIVEAKKKTVGVIGEFKKFITRGNVLDMAVGEAEVDGSGMSAGVLVEETEVNAAFETVSRFRKDDER